MLTFLCIGDPHFQENNQKQIDDLIDQTIQLTRETRPDFVVIMGDTLHNHEKVNSRLQSKATKYFETLADICCTLVIIGNHDYPNNNPNHFNESVHAFSGLRNHKNPNLVIVDQPKSITVRDPNTNKRHRIIASPYTKPGMFRKNLLRLKNSIEDEPPILIFCHQEFRGVKFGNVESLNGDKWSVSDPFVVSGHIHKRHMLQDNIFYVGTPYPTNFGEDNDKTVSIIEYDEKINIKNIRLKVRYKKTVQCDISDIDNLEVKRENNVDLRICIRGDAKEIKSRKSELEKRFNKESIKLHFVPNKEKYVAKKTQDFEKIVQERLGENQDLLEIFQKHY